MAKILRAGITADRTMTWPDRDAVVMADGWADVRMYGAVGNGISDDTAAIQSAINAVVAAGGGLVFFPAQTFKITAALVINMGVATSGLSLMGCGRGASQITQGDSTKDVLKIGVVGGEFADNIHVHDLRLTGGRYGLNLNNALQGVFARLLIESNHTCIYLQGQNEGHSFRDCDLIGNGTTVHGVWGAVANGGTAATGLDLPEMQKCFFERIRIFGMTDTAMLITAGVLNGQQSSGANLFRSLVFESNRRGSIEFHYSFATSVDGMTIEESLDTAGVYSALKSVDASTVSARNLYLISGATKHQYLAYVHGATLAVSDSVLSGAGTAEIRNDGGGTALSVINTNVDDASGLSFADATCRALSCVVGLRDGGANLIETDVGVIATALLPSAATAQNGQIVIEDAGAGDRNLVIYAGGQRFRIDGGSAF